MVIHPALCGHSPCGLGRDLLAWLGLEEGGRTICLAGQRASSTELGASENSVCWSWSSQITWPVTCHFTEVDPEQQTGRGHGDIPVVAPLGLPTMEPSLPRSLGSRSACSPVYHHPDGWASHGPGAGMAVMMTESPTAKVTCSHLYKQDAILLVELEGAPGDGQARGCREKEPLALG